MDFVLEILKISIPALIVFITAYFSIKTFVQKEREALESLNKKHYENQRLQLLKETRKTLIPLRLQAYERITIFCSRMELGGLISRTRATEAMSAHLYKTLLQQTIEEEFNHNITQQVYMTDELWNIIIIAKKEARAIVEKVYKDLDPLKSSAQDFLQAMVTYMSQNDQVGHAQAMLAIKKEVSVLFE